MLKTTTPHLAPFALALADTFDPAFHNPIGMLATPKINGVRCIVHLQTGCEPRFYSKAGHQLTGLDELHPPLRDTPFLTLRKECVLDCELTLQSGDTAEDFNSLVSQIQRKNHTLLNPRLHVLDLLTTEEFTNPRNCTRSYRDRHQVLSYLIPRTSPALLNLFPGKFDAICYDKPLVIDSQAHLQRLIGIIAENQREGLVLRANERYRPGRGAFLKIKEWQDLELACIGYSIEGDQVIALQVQYGGQSLTIREGVNASQLAPFAGQLSQLLSAELTIGFRSDPLTPFLIAIHPGGRTL